MNSLEQNILIIIRENIRIKFLDIVKSLSDKATQDEIAAACVKLQSLQIISSEFNTLSDPNLLPEQTVYKIN